MMAHRSRNPDEHLFFSAAEVHFTVRVLHGPPLRPLGARAELPPIPAQGGNEAEAAAESEDPATVRIIEFRLIAKDTTRTCT